MGSLGDNLLKLTEFPFSYSLISLLTLTFLGEGLLDQPPERLAPLLILMGFVATTLSMTDPIGVLIKEGLYGFRGRVSFGYYGESFIFSRSLRKIRTEEVPFGPHPFSEEAKEEYNEKLVDMLIDLPMFRGPLRDAFWLSAIPPTMLICLSPNFRDIFSSIRFRRGLLESEGTIGFVKFERVLKVLKLNENEEIFSKLLSLKKSSLGTAWMVREIDKITAMVYFSNSCRSSYFHFSFRSIL
jgi:hypothetical protein